MPFLVVAFVLARRLAMNRYAFSRFFSAACAAAASGWLALGLALAPEDAAAYLDPGTGSMLLSIVVGLASSGYFFIRRLPSLLRSLLFRVQGRGAMLEKSPIVFYAESAAYWGTFEPVLSALSQKGAHALYLTSDEKDPVFQAKLPGIEARFIGKGNAAYTALGFLEAGVFALTTPGIDVLQIRRSKGVKRYVHLVHSVTDIQSYKLYSFDYYDAVFCAGQYQAASLRKLEAIRGTAKKALPLVGCAYFDRMTAERAASSRRPEANIVLIAPTWGPSGLLSKTGAAIPKALAEAGCHVILRPHPQSFVSEKPLMDKLAAELAPFKNIEWDRRPNGFESLSRAAVLISDFSGVVFDYAFVFERPAVTVGDGIAADGYEAWDLQAPAWEMGILDKIGIHLRCGEEDQAAAAAKTLMADAGQYAERIREIRRSSIVNFGCAGPAIADELIRMSEDVQNPAGGDAGRKESCHA